MYAVYLRALNFSTRTSISRKLQRCLGEELRAHARARHFRELFRGRTVSSFHVFRVVLCRWRVRAVRGKIVYAGCAGLFSSWINPPYAMHR